MKRGEFAVPPAPAGTQPDLSGLSCRFEEMPSARGLILSVLVVPARGADPRRFSQGDRGHHRSGRAQSRMPGGRCPPGGPPLRWPPAGVEYRSDAPRAAARCSKRRADACSRVTLFAYVLMRFGIKRRRFRAEELCAAGGREFRLPQI